MLKLRLLSSLEKVFPDKTPDISQKPPCLSALSNETVSFQIAYLYPSDKIRSWATLKLKASPKLDIKIRRVNCIHGSIPKSFKTDEGYISTDSGVYPDLLSDFPDSIDSTSQTKRLPLVAGFWQSVWVDISLRSRTPSETFDIDVFVEDSQNEVLANEKTTVRFISAYLPELDIPRLSWLHVDCLSNYYDIDVFSECHWQILESYISYAVEHGINSVLTPIHTPPLDTEIGGDRTTVQLIDVKRLNYPLPNDQNTKSDVSLTNNLNLACNAKYEFNFEKFDRWIGICKRVGVTYFEIAHLFTQWGAKHSPKIMGTVNGDYVHLFSWDTNASSDEYTNYLNQLLPALTAKLNEHSITDRTIFHLSDEPESEDHVESYLHARNVVIPFLERFKIVDAISSYNIFKKCNIPVPISAVDGIEPFIEAGLDELWCYYCCTQSYKVPNHFFMLPSYRARILGVLLYKFNIKGFLHWGYNFYNSMHSAYPLDPFMITDADGTFPSGDAFLVYPGKDGRPQGSIRLMVLMQAFNDYRALRLLESLKSREFVLDLIAEGLTEDLRFASFPQNANYLLNLRCRVNDEIERLL